MDVGEREKKRREEWKGREEGQEIRRREEQRGDEEEGRKAINLNSSLSSFSENALIYSPSAPLVLHILCLLLI